MKILWKFLIFCFVGGSSLLIDLIFFNLFFWIGAGFAISRIFGISFGITYNFFMNRNLTFSARENMIKKQVVRYSVVYVISNSVNFLVSLFVVYLLGEGVLQANIAAISGVLASIPISFLGSLLWVFKK